MQKQDKLLATIFLLAVLSVLPFVNAAVLDTVLYTPLNDTNHTGTVTMNCTTIFTTTNVTVYANSSTGTMTSLGALTNTSRNAPQDNATVTAWEGTATITSANDGTGYNISCYADNGTDQTYSAEIAATGIMLDTTDPVCNLSVEHPTIAYKGNQKIIYYSSDVIERVSTAMTIDGPGKYTTVVATGANGPIEFDSNDTKYIGSWALDILVTDRAGNTCTDSVTFKSYMPDGVGEIPAEPRDYKGLLIVIVLAGIAYFYFKKD